MLSIAHKSHRPALQSPCAQNAAASTASAPRVRDEGDWTASIRLILFDKLARARTGFEDAATAPTSEASKAAVIFGQMMPNCPSREFLEFEPTKRVAVSAMSSNMRLRS